MKKGKLKRFTAFLLVFAMVMSVMPTAVYASEGEAPVNEVRKSQDGINVTKKAEFTGNIVNGNPEIKVTFTVDTNNLQLSTENVVKEKTDVVLVVDNSSSMGEAYHSTSKLYKAKTAAAQFAKDLYEKDGAELRIGLVYFDADVDADNERMALTPKGEVQNLDDHALIKKINSITKGSGTNIQAGLYHAGQILRGSSATNKIIVLLSDGEPYDSYQVDTDNTEGRPVTINSTKAKEAEYTVNNNYNYSSVEKSNDASVTPAVDEAYLTRQLFDDNINIFTIGYDIDNNQTAKSTLLKIGDKDVGDKKYNFSSNKNGLGVIFNSIVGRVDDIINQVKLTDLVPAEMTRPTNFFSSHSSEVTGQVLANGDVEFDWGQNQLQEDQIYTLSFDTTLNLSLLTKEQRESFYESGHYFNTNGEHVVVDGIGVESSTLAYNGRSMKLNSPQLPLKSYLYDVEYYYDSNDNGEYDEVEVVVEGKTVNEKYLFIDYGEKDVSISEADESGYVLDKVIINTNQGSIGDMSLTEDTYVKIYYCKDDKKTINVTKVWEDDDDRDRLQPESVQYVIKDSNNNVVHTGTLSEENDWTDSKSGLNTVEEYTVTEVTEIIGYGQADVEMSTTPRISEDGVRTYECTITNTHEIEEVNVNVSVQWVDNNDQDGVRPDNVVVTLYKKVEDELKSLDKQIIVDASKDTQVTFKDLPKNEDGEEIEYVVKQSSVAEKGYDTTTQEAKNDFVFINTHTPDTNDVTVTKRWRDKGNSDERPSSINVQLMAGASKVGEEVELNAANGWKHTWHNLPVKAGGQPIIYNVAENLGDNQELSKYTVMYNGLEITNTYGKDEFIDIPVTKIWDDGENVDNSRPSSIEVELLANGKVVDTKTIIANAEGKWEGIFEDKIEYDEEGNKIEYTIQEKSVPSGYTSDVDGFIITNSREYDTVTKTVTKKWVGDENVMGDVRPGKIEVELLADGAVVETAEITASNDWKKDFTNLPKNVIKEGKSVEIDYTVREKAVDNYKTTYSEENKLEITNTYVPVLTSKTVQKVWDDSNNHDGLRPKSINITLTGKAGDEVIYTDTKSITGDTNIWQYTFENIPVFDSEGERVVYTATETIEENASKYELVSNEEDDDGIIVLTNKHVIEKKKVIVEKIWQDDNDRDGIRPDSITVVLKKNGVVTSDVKVLSDDNDWKATWTNLDVYGVIDAQNSVTGFNVYTVEEVLGEGVTREPYTVSYPTPTNNNSEADVKAEIVNSYNVAKTQLTVTKSWDDNDNQDGIRPSAVNVQLYANGEFVEGTRTELNASNNWTKTWTDLFVNEDGEKIEYSVVEDEVIGYDSDAISENGQAFGENSSITITNSHTPDVTTFTVTKVWDDNNNQDGVRPKTIGVQLYANGDTYGDPVMLSAPTTDLTANTWTYTWEGLAKKSDGDDITYTVDETVIPEGYQNVVTTTDNGATITNKHNVATTTYKVTKVWDDNNNQDGIRPESVKVTLKANGKTADIENSVVELDKENNWTYTWTELDKKADGTVIDYSVDEEEVAGYTKLITESTNGTEATITNTHVIEKIKLTLLKKWEGGSNKEIPASIKVKVLANGNEFKTVTLTKKDKWTKTITVDKMDSTESIVYTVDEVSEVSGYTLQESNTSVSGASGTLEIVNKYNVEKADFTISKVWNDANNQDGIRPNITGIVVTVYANNEEYKTVILHPLNKWKVTLEDLEVKRDGEPITYTAKEVFVPEGYISSAAEPQQFKNNNLVITNTHEVFKTKVKVKKIWLDDDNNDGARPDSVDVTLYANGDAVEDSTITLSKENDWKSEWNNLDLSNNGRLINYTVEEDKTESKEKGYFSTVIYSVDTEGKIAYVTNARANAKRTFTVEKVWDDNNNNDGIRPDSVKVKLYADGVEVKNSQVTLNAKNNWKYTWKNLNVIKDSKTIKYTVQELPVDGYTPTVQDTENGQKIVNTHKNEQIELTIKKAWLGDTEEVNERAPITVKLYANGEEATQSPVILTATNNWTAKVNVDKKANKKDIVYTIEEISDVSGYDLEGYSAAVTGSNGTLIVTNQYNVEKKSFTVEKTWDDANNQDGIRPESVQVQLMVTEGDETKECGEPVTLNPDANNKWTYTWDNLEVARDGKTFTYSVKEVEVTEGYKSSTEDGAVSFNNDGVATITNTHEPEQTKIKVSKVWSDGGNNDGIRPSSVTINLLANGEKVKDVKLSAANNWNYTFTDLDKFVDGKEVEYTVSEENVSGYTASIDKTNEGFVVTNTHSLHTTSVSVLFNWDDLENIDNTRPEKMEVKLYADGKFTGRKAVVSSDTWKVAFYNLLAISGGHVVKYTVEQSYLPNDGTDNEYTYIGTATNTAVANFVITNKFRPTIDKDITIVWDDEENIDNTRPDEVVVQPLVDGEKYGDSVKITIEDVKDDDNNSWKGKTSKLPKYTEEGKEIVYRVIQTNVDKYTTSYSDDSFTITNKYRRLPLQPEDEDEIIEENINNNDNKFSSNKGGDKVNNKPSNTLKYDNIPETGDGYELTKYLWMLLLSAMGLVLLFEANKNKKRA